VSRSIQSTEEGQGKTTESTEAPSRSTQTARLTIHLDQETSSFLKAMATVLRCNRPEDYAHDLIAFAIATLISTSSFALAIPTNGRATQAEQSGEKIEWKKVEECIAGTPISRRRAARRIGFHRGRWIVAYFSSYCSDCDKTAVALKKTAETERVPGVTIAPAESASKWK
jgi:hypothetical protein